MLPLEHRLRKQKDFDRVYKRGRVYRTRLFMMRADKPGTEVARFAVVVSNKVSKKAVDRNRVRRRAHAAIDRLLHEGVAESDVIINIHPNAVNVTVEELEKEFHRGLVKLKLLQK